jgi:putative flippase GtrA
MPQELNELNGNLPKPKYEIFGQMTRFAVVGVINTAIDFTVLNLLIWITGIKSGNGVILLNMVSFTTATLNSYFLNKRWSFGDHTTNQNGRKFSVFMTVSIFGVIINTTVVRIISTNIDPMFGLNQTLWTNVAKVVATGFSLVWNFIGYKIFVFKKTIEKQ